MTNKHIELPAMPLSATFQGNAGTFVYAYTPEQMRDFALAAIAAHEQARVVGEPVAWMPIDTAPKDGTAIWAIGQIYSQPFQYECAWNSVEWYHGFGDGWANLAPTHWMPLPAAPGVASPPAPQEAQAGMVLAPDWKGYALLGTGRYIINHSADFDPDLGAELFITLATEEDRTGNRQIGETRDSRNPGQPVESEDMVLRIGFLNERGLFALEDQLRIIRETHFAAPVAQPATEQAEAPDSYDAIWNALQRIDSAAAMLPTYTVDHEGGIDAFTQNIVDAITRLATQPTASNAGERGILNMLDLLIANYRDHAKVPPPHTDPWLFDAAATREAIRAALASKPPQGEQKPGMLHIVTFGPAIEFVKPAEYSAFVANCPYRGEAGPKIVATVPDMPRGAFVKRTDVPRPAEEKWEGVATISALELLANMHLGHAQWNIEWVYTAPHPEPVAPPAREAQANQEEWNPAPLRQRYLSEGKRAVESGPNALIDEFKTAHAAWNGSPFENDIRERYRVAHAALYEALSATTPAPAGQDKEDAERWRWMWNHAHNVSFTYRSNSYTTTAVMGLHCGSLKDTVDAIRAARGDEVNQK